MGGGGVQFSYVIIFCVGGGGGEGFDTPHVSENPRPRLRRSVPKGQSKLNWIYKHNEFK